MSPLVQASDKQAHGIESEHSSLPCNLPAHNLSQSVCPGRKTFVSVSDISQLASHMYGIALPLHGCVYPGLDPLQELQQSSEELAQSFENCAAQVAGAANHAALLTPRGEMYTWGDGSGGKLGLGHDQNVAVPQRVYTLWGKVVQQIACGGKPFATQPPPPPPRRLCSMILLAVLMLACALPVLGECWRIFLGL